MRRFSAAFCVAILLAGCSGSPPGVLDANDVPGADSLEDVANPLDLMNCDAVPRVERTAAALQPIARTVVIDVAEKARVVSTAAEKAPEVAIDDISEAIDECVEANGEQGTTTTRLNGLPDGVVGYEAVSSGSPEDTYGTRLWTREDERLIGVGMMRPQSSADPGIDLVALLETAVERSKDLGRDG